MSICISQSGQSLADHISTGWTEAADIHQAQDLFAALSQQHEACAKLLAFKDSLLAAMKAALTAKEGKYVQTLGMHGKVICTACLPAKVTCFMPTSCPNTYLIRMILQPFSRILILGSRQSSTMCQQHHHSHSFTFSSILSPSHPYIHLLIHSPSAGAGRRTR